MFRQQQSMPTESQMSAFVPHHSPDHFFKSKKHHIPFQSPSFIISKHKKPLFQSSQFKAYDQSFDNHYFKNTHRNIKITKIRQRIKSQGPGPASYRIESNLFRKSISFGKTKRSFHQVRELSPGVGAYQIEQAFLRKSIGNHFPKARRNSSQIGTEKADQTDKSTRGRRKLPRESELPGPGSYSLEGKHIGGNIFPHQKRLNNACEKNIPGPADYVFEHKDHAPSARFMTAPREALSRDKILPSPQDYCMPIVIKYKQKSPIAIIGTSKRLLSEGSKDSRMNPGVGAYDISAQSHIRAAFLTSKHSEINHENIPGPNQYQPNFDVVLSKTPKFTMCKSGRMLSQKIETPGPSTYRANKKLSSIMHQFSKEKR